MIAPATRVLLAAIALAVATWSAHAEKRVALVIGNAAYENTAMLANPVNDADDMAAALERVGFEVQVERNLTKRGMESALARFARSAEDADAAMFFYAGHGIQYRGTNLLMPVDARLEDEVSINYELLRIDEVLFGLGRARGVKLLVLDACRNNPLLDRLLRRAVTRDAALARGLARIDRSAGMLIAYSTQADQVAVDGTGRNSPFTSALVKYIAEPGLEVGLLFRRVASEVDRLTGGRQLPELSITLRGEFYLNTRESDLQAWARLQASNDRSQLADFVQRYPDSVLTGEARRRLDVIDRENAERQRIERERVERERLARDQAERERIERERVARERLRAEQAERDRTAREQAERDRLVRERGERERLLADQAERLARLQAELERIERERVAQERLREEQAEQERIGREQAQREQAARDRAERERTERERQPSARTEPQIAMLPPAPEPKPPAASSPPAGMLVQEIKKQLSRVGCLAGPVDDKWATGDTRRSIAKFVRFARLHVVPEQPTAEFLDAIRGSTSRICPLECGARQVERNGACARKICPSGQKLDAAGQCVAVAKPKPPPQARSRGSGGRCFVLGGRSFCE